MLNGARILVVEDEPLIAMELAQTIEDMGGVVASARSRQEALKLAEASAFDGAILDVRLPDGTGFDVAAYLSTIGVPFLFCTADNERHANFSAWPGVAIIPKPHNSDVIRAALLVLLKRRG